MRFVPGFGTAGLGFTLNCQVAAYADQLAVASELHARIAERFRGEGIDFPPVPRAVLRQAAR